MYPITDTQLKRLYALKLMHTQMKMNAYKDFHILLVCLSFIKPFLDEMRRL